MDGSTNQPSAVNSISQNEDQDLDIAQIRMLTVGPCSDFLELENTADTKFHKRTPSAYTYSWVPAEASLGDLDIFSVELVQLIILQFDLLSLTHFRGVNRRAREITDSVPEYNIIITHARYAFCTILRVEMGHLISCQALYDKLCSAKCESCGDFAVYLYMLRFERVCRTCFTDGPRFLPVKQDYAKRAYGLSRKKLATLPSLKPIPGLYSLFNKHHTHRRILDKQTAINAGIEVYGSYESMRKYVTDRIARNNREYEELYRQEKAKGRKPALRRSLSPRLDDKKSMNGERYMAVTRMPWYNEDTRMSDWGFYCRACKEPQDGVTLVPDWWTNSWRRFNVESFREHIKKFGRIVNYRHVRS